MSIPREVDLLVIGAGAAGMTAAEAALAAFGLRRSPNQAADQAAAD